MVGIKDFDALEQISNTAEKLSAGEILQLEKSISKSMTEAVYFEMINQINSYFNKSIFTVLSTRSANSRAK